jgi:branched-subunit amino acid ABC-type transport system permease component
VNTVVEACGFGLFDAAILALAAVGFTLQFGASNVFNLAYAAVMTACAFVAYWLTVTVGLDPWLALIVAGVAGSVLSSAMYFGLYGPFVRRGAGPFVVVMVSLSLLLIITYVLEILFGAGFFTLNFGLSGRVAIGALVWSQLEVVIMCVGAACVLLLHLFLRYTRAGKIVRATAGDADLARNCGVDTRKVMMLVWLLSGFLCGISGVLYALNTTVFSFDSSGDFLLLVFAAAVLGGVGEVYGAVLGALCIGLATELTAIVLPGLKEVAAFGLLLVVLLVRPAGLLSTGRAVEEEAQEAGAAAW